MPPSLDGVEEAAGPCRAAFATVAAGHLRVLLDQLLVAEGVANAAEWAPVLVRLAQEAAGTLSPMALTAAGNLDPRHHIKASRRADGLQISRTRRCQRFTGQLLHHSICVHDPPLPLRAPQVKRLAGCGAPADSAVIAGVACRKNVAHKRMRTTVSRPRVALLGGALEYSRAAAGSAGSKLSSFEQLMEQEHEYLRSCVERLTSLRPDVLLVERSVARCAAL